MSTFKKPVGPQSPKVYWRRRLLVGLGALAVIIVIILIVVRPGSGASGGGATPKPETSKASTPASPAASDASKDGAACLPANVKLEAVTDKTTYGGTEQPMISMKITNTGTVACTINAGSTQQELIVTSGSEKIWNSKDCQTTPVDAPVTLKPNAPQTTQAIAWDRTRSATTTCSASRPPVTAGGASYHLSVKVGPLTSKGTVQFILN
ncbi:hypothetical protein [Glaciihabitans sp. UYNi722]|uniref:hypothetical protein n=1 Tax=Glaciihabitans sp. UYNi722 TaxID=3156344 RepID=UPI003393C4D4